MLSSETRAFILALAPVSVTSALAIKGNLAVLRRSAGFPVFVGLESVKCWPPSVSGFPPAKSLDGELTANCAMPRACCTEHCNSTRCSPERKHARVGVCGVGAGYRKLRAKARNEDFVDAKAGQACRLLPGPTLFRAGGEVGVGRYPLLKVLHQPHVAICGPAVECKMTPIG